MTPASVLLRGVGAGLLLVALAVVGGLLGAIALAGAGVSVGFTTAETGLWLGGLALLGDWQRDVVTSVPLDGSFAERLRVVPLTLTALAFAGTVWWTRRTGDGAPSAVTTAAQAAAAGVAAGGAAALLAWLTRATAVTTTQAGTVEIDRGTGVASTALGAMALAVLGVLWARFGQRPAWRRGWHDARALLVWPGLVITLVSAVAAGLLVIPGVGVPVTLLVLAPLLGAAALLVAGGAPLVVDVSLVTAEPIRLWLPVDSLPAWVVGLLALAALAAATGWWRGRREPRHGWVAVAVTAGWSAAVAGGLGVLTAVVGSIPPGLGGDVRLQVGVLGAVAVGFGLGVVQGTVAVLAHRGSAKSDLASGKTSAMSTTSPAAGNASSGTVRTTRVGSPAASVSTTVSAT